jgi:hypothetical protein
MQAKRLLIALALLAALGGGVWWSNRAEKSKADQPDPKAPPKLLSLARPQIAKVEITRAGGETTVLEIPKDNEFKLTAPAVYPVEKEAAQSLLSAIAEPASDKVVEEKPAGLEEFGLREPKTVISVTLRDGKTKTLKLGDEAPVGGGVYAAVDGDARVFLLGSYAKGNIDKKAADLRDKRLLRFAPDTLAKVALQGKGPAIEFFKQSGSDWQITAPRKLRANNWEVEELVRKLGDAKLDPALDESQAKDLEKQFGGAAPVATVTVSGGDGAARLEVRKNKEGRFYGKSSQVEGAHLLPDDLAKTFDKGLNDFRNKKLFDFGFSEPTRIEYKDDKSAFTATRSQDKWLREGKTLDSVGVQSLIDKLRELSAASWPQGSLGPAEMTIVVVSNDGKRTEKVTLAKAGAKWRAQRDGEPDLYELEAAPVDELRSTAGAVKEQAPPKPATPPAKK